MKYYDYKKVADLLDQHADKNNLTVEGQAALFGVSKMQIYKIKNGETVLGRSKNGLEICKALGVEYMGLGRYKVKK